jgi:hypothetical protein
MNAMRAIAAIVRVTIGEAVRRRIFWTLLVFALLLCGGSLILGEVTVGDRAKAVKDLCLSGMSLLGLVMAVWMGSEAFGRTLEGCPAEPLLSRAVSRECYLLARYLGLAAVLLMNCAAMGIISWGLLRLIGAPFGLGLLRAGSLIYVELLLVAAAGFLFASVLRPAVSLYATLCMVIVGRSIGEARGIMAAGGRAPLVSWLYGLLPDLSRLDIKAAVVHDLPLPQNCLLGSTLYGLGYAGLLLALAMLALDYKDLT